MKKQQIIFTIFLIILCIMFFGCEAVAELFHGEKPEGPPSYTVRYEANGASGAALALDTPDLFAVKPFKDEAIGKVKEKIAATSPPFRWRFANG